jgi:hypothetical protein
LELFIAYYWCDEINENKKGGAVITEMGNAYKILVAKHEGNS